MADPSSTVTVRPLLTEDTTAWTSLWQGYLAFYKAQITTEVSDLTFNRLIDPGEPMEGALALVDGEAAGLAHLVSHRSTWTMGDYGYLQDLFTAESTQAMILYDRVAERSGFVQYRKLF